MTEEESGVSALFDAYYAVGEEICERVGHDYEDVIPPAGSGKAVYKQCERCNKIKEEP